MSLPESKDVIYTPGLEDIAMEIEIARIREFSESLRPEQRARFLIGVAREIGEQILPIADMETVFDEFDHQRATWPVYEFQRIAGDTAGRASEQLYLASQ